MESPLSAPLFQTFVHTASQLTGSTPDVICTVNRPPKPNKDFLNYVAALFIYFSVLFPNLIIIADFSIHMENDNSLLSIDFTCLECFGVQQYIVFPTHSKGNIFNLVCCSGVTVTL